MEEDKNIHSPIMHSMKQDAVSGAKTIVGSNDVPSDEALLLAKMQSANSKKRRTSILAVIGILFLILGIFLFLIPNNFFVRKDTGIVVKKTKTQNIIGVDISYEIKIPTDDEIDDFKKKTFDGDLGIAEIVIKDSSSNVSLFANLAPLVSSRFIDNFLSVSTGEYVYGFYTDSNKSYPYFAFSVSERHLADEKTLEAERTMYNDLMNILMLPNNSANEFLQFESNSSVRLPARVLKNVDQQIFLVYGFPVDNVVLFTTSIDAYNALRNRILIGY